MEFGLEKCVTLAMKRGILKGGEAKMLNGQMIKSNHKEAYK